jgi:hypothetical protein
MRSIFLYAVLILPAALFVANMGGLLWYMRDHAIRSHTHLSNPRYDQILHEYEVAGGVVGAMPGTLISAWLYTSKTGRRAVVLKETGCEEESVWPPPPSIGATRK